MGRPGEAPLFLLAEQMVFSGNAIGKMKLFKELYRAVRNRLYYWGNSLLTEAWCVDFLPLLFSTYKAVTFIYRHRKK